MTLRERFLAGATYEQMVAAAVENVSMWTAQRRLARVPDELVARAGGMPGRWHLLALSEDWCGDAVNALPVLDELAARVPSVSLRILGRDANPDLMDAHLTNGTSRSIPVVLVLDGDFVERGWWGPRPSAIQAWFHSPAGQALDKAERYKRMRAMYARDRGVSIVSEVLDIMGRAAAADAASASAVGRAVLGARYASAATQGA